MQCCGPVASSLVRCLPVHERIQEAGHDQLLCFRLIGVRAYDPGETLETLVSTRGSAHDDLVTHARLCGADQVDWHPFTGVVAMACTA